jgi:predicted methyltransferase
MRIIKTKKTIKTFIGFLLLFFLFSCVNVKAAFASVDAFPDQFLSFEETLEKMMDIAGIKPGMIIGEIGSGGGPFTFRMADRIGKDGKLYANDIDQEALDSINKKKIQNIETVLGEIDDPVFPVRNLDMVIMRSVFHDLENPLSCFVSGKFGQMSAFLKLQIICDNLKLGEMHEYQEKAIA